MDQSPNRGKLAATLRWLAPSAAVACGGALTGGLIEGLGISTEGFLAIGAAAGFVTILAFPALLATSIAVRALWSAWRVDQLDIVEADGSAPRLAAWAAVAWIALFVLAWSLFQGTWLLAAFTAFKPITLSFAEPVVAVAAAIAMLAVSRPLARGLGALYRRFPKRLMTPRVIAASAVLKTALVGYLIWRLLAKPRLGPIDLSLLHVPVATLAGALVLALAWPYITRPLARILVVAALAAATIAAVVSALVVWQTQPSMTLAIWGERPVAGLAIDKLMDLDAIRARMSLAEFRPAARAGSPHPDIILITIDTVRADHTPPYGGQAEMPVLRELAARGATFDWAYSPSNVTRRSLPSMVTGLAPTRVKGRVVGWALRIDPRHVLLAERMLAGGYDTAGFVCCGGFWGDEMRTGLQRGLAHLEIEGNGAKLAHAARTWLEAREKIPPEQRKPLFLWMHIIEPHNWNSGTGVPANEEEKRRFYDRSLTTSDAMMVDVLAPFTNRKPETAPIVIVTADHGEALGDHGQPYHSTDLYNSQIHVPFVVAGPGITAGHIPETVSLTDLTPTILELGGFVPPTGPGMDGRSLADLLQGRRQPNPVGGTAFAAMIRDRSNPGGLMAVVHGPWKLIESPTNSEVYNVERDPREQNNLVLSRMMVIDELHALLREFQTRAALSPFP